MAYDLLFAQGMELRRRETAESEKARAVLIVEGRTLRLVLEASPRPKDLSFEAAELNLRYALNGDPGSRRIGPCIDWLSSQLPQEIGSLEVTGGMRHYLTRVGVPLRDGTCRATHFAGMASWLASLPLSELEKFLPERPHWMHQAIATHCFILGILRRSQETVFISYDSIDLHP